MEAVAHAPTAAAVPVREPSWPLRTAGSSIDPRARFAAADCPPREQLYLQMALIRAFEERVLELFSQGELFGTTHAAIGQEADSVGTINHLRRGDIVVASHRCHGHFLTWADRPDLLFAELMGRANGLVGGRGGSQHISYGNFYSNGVQGGIVPMATGMALAEKLAGSGAIAMVFLGDGTLGEGVVYETLNIAALWRAPVLFVVEDNGWAQSTPSRLGVAGDMLARGKAFGIETDEIASTDAEELLAHFGPIVERVREEVWPHLSVIRTHRICAHSKGDDCRPQSEIEAARAADPLPRLGARLDEGRAREIEAEAAARIAAAEAWARAQPFPELEPGLARR